MQIINLSELWPVAWPQIFLLAAAFVVLLFALWRSATGYLVTAVLTGLAYLISGIGFTLLHQSGSGKDLDLFTFDPYGNLLGLLICVIGLVTVIFSYQYFKDQDEVIPEVFPLLLFASFGMTGMVVTTHLLTFVLLLEVMSLSLYILVGLRRHHAASSEAALKYFLLGSVASAFLLLGIAFFYGGTGSLNAVIPEVLPVHIKLVKLLMTGAVLVLLGFVFKVAAFPFHFWAPDVYDGAPMPVTGFMAAGVKVATIGALVRILLAWEAPLLSDLLYLISMATMVVGSLAALRQKSLKRIMAYSSIAHAGYLLLGCSTLVVASGPRPEAVQPLLVYLVVYALLTLGAFSILSWLSQRGKELSRLSELDGLANRHPVAAAFLSIFLISLAGIPPTAGFFAKYFVFSQAIKVGYDVLAIVGILMSAISLYYYLGPVVRMYFFSEGESKLALKPQRLVLVSAGILAFLALFLGIFPNRLLEMADPSHEYVIELPALEAKLP